MNSDELARHISRAADHCRAIGLCGDENLSLFARIPEQAALDLAQVLASDPRIIKLSHSHYKLVDNSGAINLFQAAQVLLSRVLLGVSPSDIADSLFRIAETGSVELWVVRIVATLPIVEEFELDPELLLLRPSSLPDVEYTKQVFSSLPAGDHHFRTSATGALVARYKNFQAIREGAFPIGMGADGIVKPDEELLSRGKAHLEIFENGRLALMLSSTSIPDLRQSYSVVVDPGWISLASNGLGSSSGYPRRPVQGSQSNSLKSASIYQNLKKSYHKPIILLSTAKLESSRRESEIAEQYIDLGIAAEVILMHDSNPDNTEISYKIATRAAWLLGKDGQERLRIFELVRDLYSKRSKAVHNGELKRPKTSELMLQRHEQYLKHDDLITRLIAKIAERDKYPDWKKIVLGA